MVSNFKVLIHHNDENLNLKLNGGLNGASTLEVIKILDRYCNKTGTIFVQTSGLGSPHPIGSDILKGNKFRYENLVVIGEPDCCRDS